MNKSIILSIDNKNAISWALKPFFEKKIDFNKPTMDAWS